MALLRDGNTPERGQHKRLSTGVMLLGAVSPDRALCLPTFSHFVLVNKTSLSLSLLSTGVSEKETYYRSTRARESPERVHQLYLSQRERVE